MNMNDNTDLLNMIVSSENAAVVNSKQNEEISVTNKKEKKSKEKTLSDEIISSLLQAKATAKRVQLMAHVKPHIFEQVEEIAIKSRTSVSKVVERILEEALK